MQIFESNYRRQAIELLNRNRAAAKQELHEEWTQQKQHPSKLRRRLSAITAPFFGPVNRPMP